MKKFFVVSGLLVVPFLASAQTVVSSGGLFSVFKTITNVINTAIPLVLALAVLYFFWGLAQYVLNSANEDKKEEGRNIMIWGIIALFVMVSVWGLVRMLQTTFGLDTTTPITAPKVL